MLRSLHAQRGFGLYAERPLLGAVTLRKKAICPSNRTSGGKTPALVVVVILLLRGVVAVIQEPNAVRDAERVAESGHKRRDRIRTHAHDVIGFQVNIRLRA